jgi:glyoxylase-like metal-dependent hydrolase (beta-lactamase superfamily II)
MTTTTEHAGATEVAPGVWHLPLSINRHFLGGSNGYLIRDHDGYLLVDCGADTPECGESLEQHLAGLGIPVHAVHTVVVTHGHGDHWGLADGLRARTQARIVLHEREAVFIGYPYVGDESDRRQMGAWLHRYGFPADEVAAHTSREPLGDRADHATPLHADMLVQGGETLEVGPYRFEVLWMPGHTPGHICLYDPAHRLLLSGDHILGVTTPNVSLHPLMDGNPMPGYLDSLSDFAGRDIALTLPGHGTPIADLAALAADLTRRQLRRRDQAAGLLTDVPQTAYALATQAWAERGRRPWAQMHGYLRRNGVGMLAAHLDVLAERGEVERLDDGDVIAYRRRC